MLPGVQKALTGVGLPKNEALVLGTLLERGPMFASRIAERTRINRTTTYGVLKELIKKGLASRDKRHGAGMFQSITPRLLPSYIERRREELAAQEKEVRDLVPQLMLLREKMQSLPNARFFEGIHGVKQAYEDTLINNQGKELRTFTGTDAIYRGMGMEWLRYYWNKRTKLDIRCTVIAPDTQWSAVMKKEDGKYLRTTKCVAEIPAFDSEIDIYDNKVGFFSFSKEHPVAVIIEDETIQQTMQILFNYIAKTAES